MPHRGRIYVDDLMMTSLTKDVALEVSAPLNSACGQLRTTIGTTLTLQFWVYMGLS